MLRENKKSYLHQNFDATWGLPKESSNSITTRANRRRSSDAFTNRRRLSGGPEKHPGMIGSTHTKHLWYKYRRLFLRDIFIQSLGKLDTRICVLQFLLSVGISVPFDWVRVSFHVILVQFQWGILDEFLFYQMHYIFLEDYFKLSSSPISISIDIKCCSEGLLYEGHFIFGYLRDMKYFRCICFLDDKEQAYVMFFTIKV